MTEPPPDSATLHRRLDALDEQLLDLLEARIRTVGEALRRAAEAGEPPPDAQRERELLDAMDRRLALREGSPLPREALRPLFRRVLSACLATDQGHPVAFLGPLGTFSHVAAHEAFGLGAQYLPQATIAEVFAAVERGEAAHGVVPVENSSAGTVTPTVEALIESPLSIQRELVVVVEQCLLAQHDELERIQRVYSHPQPLAQCRRWLARHLPTAQLVATSSTTAAARQAAEDDAGAAVASELAAELYQLRVVRRRIQDQANNATRFFVVGHGDSPRTGADKTSLLLTTPHVRGALKRVLEVLDDAGLNLTRIESRPHPQHMWEYVFFTDVEGHREDAPVARALDALRAAGSLQRVLGSYPRAALAPPQPER